MKYKRIKKELVLILILLISFGTVFIFGKLSMSGEENNILTKDMFIEEALEYTNVIDNLENQKIDLVKGYTDYNKIMEPLKAVYDMLPTYKALGVLYDIEVSQSNHIRYLDLLALNVQEVLVEPELIEFGELQVTLADEIPTMMSIVDYMTYTELKDAFSALGILDHNVSKNVEYNTFVDPISIFPISMLDGINGLSSAVKTTESSIKGGAAQLYDSVILLQDMLILLDQSYNSSLQSYNRNIVKYEKGLLSEYELNKSKNQQIIDRINRDTLSRKIRNSKMNINVMRGIEPTVSFSIEIPKQFMIKIETLEFYKETARQNSDSIKSINTSINYQKQKLDIMDDYISKNDNRYKTEEYQLKIFELQLKEAINDIELSITENYNDLVQNYNGYFLALEELEDANKQLERLQINLENGLMAEYVVNDFKILVTQKANNRATKLRDYMSALTALYNITGLDFPY